MPSALAPLGMYRSAILGARVFVGIRRATQILRNCFVLGYPKAAPIAAFGPSTDGLTIRIRTRGAEFLQLGKSPELS